MPEEVKSTYLIARRSSRLAAATMGVLGVIQLIIFALYLVTITQEIASMRQLVIGSLRLGSILSTLASTYLLGSFLWHFGGRESPFGARQSLRLAGAAVLYLVRMAVDAAAPVLSPVEMGDGALTLTQQSGIDLQLVTIVVFLACLAIVMRYGDALKEDSDSIA